MRTEKKLAAGALALALAGAAACRTAQPGSSQAMPVASTGFASPDAALDALVAAARSDSVDALRAVLGPDADDVLEGGDPVALQNELARFVALWDEHHATVAEDDALMLVVGAGEDEWLFPIPLVQRGGRWSFDTAAGEDELVTRRIGRNELAVIEVCRATVDAQDEYRALDPEGSGGYAAQFFSDPGRRNGLYWPDDEGAPPSPLGELVAAAAAEGYERGTPEDPRPYQGYYYRLLTEQGPSAPGGARDWFADGAPRGYAVLAWPAEYGRSGVMTFLANRFGIVYERDLGERTAALAGELRTFDPDQAWALSRD